jgi:transcriptional regulator with XRE-family HTH domain
MIKALDPQQKQSKYACFAQRLSTALVEMDVQPSPVEVARAFNKHSKEAVLKPHTVRKWLLGITLPRTQTLILLAQWLNLEPQELLKEKEATISSTNRVSFEFDFTDQEVISKYLAMTVKQKITVRLLIDAIADKK